MAPIPAPVTRSVQYETQLKAHAVYMSQFQRIQDHFRDQMNLALSAETLYNFNAQAYEILVLPSLRLTGCF